MSKRSEISRGILRSTTDTAGALRTVQATADGVDTDDDVEHAEPYGLAAAGVAGAHVVFVNVDGDESHPIAISVSDSRYRPAVSGGAVALYDSSGKVVKLSSSGIQLGASASLGVARTTDAVSVTIPIGTVAVGFSGGAAVMNAAPITLTGTITGGSATVKAVD